ncbi:26S proteasome regulatory subunit 7 [Rhodotorula toruloides]
MPSAFAASELKQALSEIPWGMRTYRLLPDDPAEPDAARAEVDLLEEGQSVTVSCSDGGWRIVGSKGRCRKNNAVFDTLDDLMLAVSPAFEAKRMEKLMEKLAEVADGRQKREGREVTSGLCYYRQPGDTVALASQPRPLQTESRAYNLRIHARSMAVERNIRFNLVARLCPNATGAELRSVYTEAGMFAIRQRRKIATEKDFLDAVEKVIRSGQKFSSTSLYANYQ